MLIHKENAVFWICPILPELRMYSGFGFAFVAPSLSPVFFFFFKFYHAKYICVCQNQLLCRDKETKSMIEKEYKILCFNF